MGEDYHEKLMLDGLVTHILSSLQNMVTGKHHTTILAPHIHILPVTDVIILDIHIGV